jgi:mono/diheme cytochrome c family protein
MAVDCKISTMSLRKIQMLSLRQSTISSGSVWSCLRLVIPLVALWPHDPLLFSQTVQNGGLELHTGKEIFEAGCVACHGPDGKGMPRTTIGFEPPATFPDFTDCSGTSREPNPDWKAIIYGGGPARGFSEIMPSFAEALSSEQIDKVIEYLRGFCRDDSWPRGELNLPRALITEKAFPEDEAVTTTTINAEGPSAVTNEFVYERRFGARNQIEVAVPFRFNHQDGETWHGGVGDMALGFKRALFHSIESGSIFSVSGEAVLPTGDKARDLGSGVTVFESFATYGQILPADSFLQFQGGIELPTHSDDASKAVFWRTAVGKTFTEENGRGRRWSPMLEILADRELATGDRVNWDLLPQIQVALNRRQHIRASIGVRFPVNNTGSRSTEVLFYVLWDWFDGGLGEGWK